MEEKISVIIPIYQVEKFLNKCIESVISQTYKCLEILLIDDGSKDNCPKICDQYAKEDKRIKIIHKENGGLSDARNMGIKNAKGDYIFFLDSDDWVDQRIISHLYMLIKKYDADIAECQYEKVYKEDAIINNEDKEEIKVYTPKESLENLITERSGNRVVSWNKLYKKKLFNQIEFPMGKIHEDEYTTYKLLYQCKKIVVTNLKFYYYRQRENSIISEKFNPKRLDVIQAYEEKLEFYKKKNEIELYQKEIPKFLYILLNCYYNSKKAKFNKEIVKNIKDKYRKIYREYKKIKSNNIKERVKYGLIYIIPDLVFILPVI